jgi:hypothetical protein
MARLLTSSVHRPPNQSRERDGDPSAGRARAAGTVASHRSRRGGPSIAFGASAVASYVVPVSDQPRNVTLMNLGTFVGALAFLVGAVLLLPERTHVDSDERKGVDPSGPGGQRVHSGTGHDHFGP